ncbi:FxSxx-COOH system tetratricopeptide repeat protein [Actinoplanes rectilineatus]|uniref:FxSxx-COOH system tetratricopeptide repeat protein n=1 Tax=Actinoplanes rectilineatus TaxID=113571 RepID=UPI000698F246|nr:FxSxx-COOH system tetratricopeptide repeat protein [Actinoplanes rectilineatus]
MSDDEAVRDESAPAAFGPLGGTDAGPPWEIHLVVDDHPTTVVWRDTIDAFAAATAAAPGIAVVRRWSLRVPASGEVRVRADDAGDTDDADDTGPADPGARRLILVLTDGAAAGWTTGSLAPVLRSWGRTHPLAVVHLLPPAMWRRTGLTGQRLRLRTEEPGGPNTRLTWQTDPPNPGTDALAVPLLDLDPRRLAAWTALIAAPPEAGTDLPCLLIPREPHGIRPPPVTPPARIDPVADFRAVASPPAYKLARHLAAAPLNIEVMRLLQDELLRDPLPEHLAEILVSGLIQPVPPDPEVTGDVLITHDFPPGVRGALLARGRRNEIIRVVHALDRHLGERHPEIHRLRAAVDDPAGADPEQLGTGGRRIAEVQAVVLQALSGQHLSLATSIQSQVAPVGASETPADLPVASEESMEVGMSLIEQPGTPPPTVFGTPPGAPRPAVRVPAVWGNVPPRNPNFTGRTELLDQLRAGLTAEPTAVLPEALHGLGGVGKTQVVVEFVYRNAGDYDVVWWISAERPAQITSAMVELATKLRLPVNAEAAAVPAVKEALRVGVPYARWLLVFDNADVPEDVRPYFPLGGPGHIVVTSRNPQWEAVAKKVEVDVFHRRESQALLTRRAPALSRKESDDLARVLGDLPLAIEQAAAWLAETGMQASEYLALFQEKTIELMEMSPPSDYQLPVAAAWNVSLDHLARARPAALRLLQLCAFLAPEPISRTLLSAGRQLRVPPELAAALRDPIQLGRAIREINRYALARIDHAKNTIQMHRLVQAVLIERMTPEERFAMRHSAHQLLAASNPQQPLDRERWPVYAELYPHLVASGAITDAEDDWVRDLVIGEAKYQILWGNPVESLTISEQAYRAWQTRLGPEAPQTLEIGRWLGYVLFALGRYAEAARLNAKLLSVYEKISQRNADELPEARLEAMQAVASDHRTEGRFQQALDLSREVYDQCIQRFGDDDPMTLNAAHNLAVSLRLADRFEEARDVDQTTWERKVQVYGQNHEESLRAQRGVLIDRRQLGDYLASRDEFERLGETFVDVLGERDPQTVETNRSLSVTRRKAGDHDGALAISTDALRRFEAAFGADHPGTMAAALNLSLDLRQAGRLDQAREVATDNFQRFRDRLGETHPHSLAAGGNLAIIYRLQGEVANARELNEVTLQRLRDRLGSRHVLTLSCATNLASDLFEAGEVEEARAMDTEQLEGYRAVMGENHPSTLAAALNLAIDLRALGRSDEAYALHDDTLARYQQVLGLEHPATRDAGQWQRANCDMDPMPL